MAEGSRRSTRFQDAVRLLFLLLEAGQQPGMAAPKGAARVVHSEMRLQALDFWMRNPDYLAHELIADFRSGLNPKGIEIAKAIIESEEPDLRRYPMIRYLFGAYEPLDDALALLREFDMIFIEREGNPETGRVREHHFYLMDRGALAAGRMVEVAPPLLWYSERAKLVATLAGSTPGSKLKERQYKTIQYARTTLGTTIGSIKDQVRAELCTGLPEAISGGA